MRTMMAICSALMVSVMLLAGCTSSTQSALGTDESQVRMRSIQSRAFDTRDKNVTLRTAIATLQDLGFVIDKADDVLGTVSATKMSGYTVRMTVTVRPRGETQMLVRANAQWNDFIAGRI